MGERCADQTARALIQQVLHCGLSPQPLTEDHSRSAVKATTSLGIETRIGTDATDASEGSIDSRTKCRVQVNDLDE